jgi:hypothetical protein
MGDDRPRDVRVRDEDYRRRRESRRMGSSIEHERRR